MARTITDIKQGIKAKFMNTQELSELYSFDFGDDFDTHFSRVSLENLLIDVFSFSIWLLEQLFDLHKKEVVDYIDTLKPHSVRWYRTKALQFQNGQPLVVDSDQYDNTGLSPEEVESKKVIKYCAVNEAVGESRLIVKIATESNGELAPITAGQLVSFQEYLSIVKDAGVIMTVTNFLPDILRLNMDIYYDPLVLMIDGTRIDDGSKPVEIAIREFLKALPFNGMLTLTSLVDALQNVEGIKIPHVNSASSKWINPAIAGYGDFVAIDVFKIPESGYFKVEDFSNITYKPYA